VNGGGLCWGPPQARHSSAQKTKMPPPDRSIRDSALFEGYGKKRRLSKKKKRKAVVLGSILPTYCAKKKRDGKRMDGATSCLSTGFRVPRRPGTQIAARLQGLQCKKLTRTRMLIFFLLKKKFIGFGRPMERGGGKDKSLGVDGAVDHVLMSVSLYISV
jgi:hypothetical protein